MADPFTRAKLRLLNLAMHDGRLSPGARIVFYEIIQHVNRVSGDAWPSEKRLANILQIDVKTVKRAISQLTLYNYVEVTREGRHNTYRPKMEMPKGDNLSPIGGVPTGGQGVPNGDGKGDKLSGERGQIVPSIGDKNGPLSYLREPIKENHAKLPTSSPPFQYRARETSNSGSVPSSQEVVSREEQGELRSKPDDGRFHVQLVHELGIETVEALHALDGGRPLKRLTSRRRSGPLSLHDIASARLLLEQRRVRA